MMVENFDVDVQLSAAHSQAEDDKNEKEIDKYDSENEVDLDGKGRDVMEEREYVEDVSSLHQVLFGTCIFKTE